MLARSIFDAAIGAYDVSKKQNLVSVSWCQSKALRFALKRTREITISQSSAPKTLEIWARVKHRRKTTLAATTNRAMLTPNSWEPRSSAIAAGEELYAITFGDLGAQEMDSIYMMRRAGQSGVCVSAMLALVVRLYINRSRRIQLRRLQMGDQATEKESNHMTTGLNDCRSRKVG